jgi:membrane protein YqaA with SNARE-associated domain
MWELITVGRAAFDAALTTSSLLRLSSSHGLVHHLYVLLAHLGGFGLLILSLLDSSPLSVPLGNDLLMIAMTANRHSRFVYYAAMATLGSVLGCLTVDMLSRKNGEKGFEKTVGRRRFEYIKRRVKNNALWTLAVAALLPPPFPFTAVVAGTAAFQYPRRKVLLILSFSRFARFVIEGALAIFFGRRLLRLVRSPIMEYLVAVLIVFSIAASAWALSGRMKRGR